MMIPLSLVVLVVSQASPAPTAPTAGPTAPTGEPSKATAEPAMAPDVRKAVGAMQKFYEGIRDFQADFAQTYEYKTFARTTRASGRMAFMKQGGSMRWDYLKPTVKVFVVANEKVYAYDKEARQLAVSRLSADRLSASVTFLWGQGKLDREFRISKATRPDLTGGVALELVPKTADPRFQRIFFLLDSKTFSVKATVVVDPDGSESSMTFTSPTINSGLTTDAFKIEPPEGTQIIRLDNP